MPYFLRRQKEINRSYFKITAIVDNPFVVYIDSLFHHMVCDICHIANKVNIKLILNAIILDSFVKNIISYIKTCRPIDPHFTMAFVVWRFVTLSFDVKSPFPWCILIAPGKLL